MRGVCVCVCVWCGGGGGGGTAINMYVCNYIRHETRYTGTSAWLLIPFSAHPHLLTSSTV